nr:MAG TPA: hypothetical protein [Bacteriophage sp.]
MDFTEWKGVSVLSGGSFDYLCYEDVPELMNSSSIANLESMVQHLQEYGYEDIARDTQRLIEYIQSASIRIEVLSENLNDVFHAVEWHESGDISRETMIERLENYRNGGANV